MSKVPLDETGAQRLRHPSSSLLGGSAHSLAQNPQHPSAGGMRPAVRAADGAGGGGQCVDPHRAPRTVEYSRARSSTVEHIEHKEHSRA